MKKVPTEGIDGMGIGEDGEATTSESVFVVTDDSPGRLKDSKLHSVLCTLAPEGGD